jgi:hypothetical protein
VKTAPAQLRKAALAIAKRQHPDQFGTVHPNAFSRVSYKFTEVRMSGGSVLVTRDEAEAYVLYRKLVTLT